MGIGCTGSRGGSPSSDARVAPSCVQRRDRHRRRLAPTIPVRTAPTFRAHPSSPPGRSSVFARRCGSTGPESCFRRSGPDWRSRNRMRCGEVHAQAAAARMDGPRNRAVTASRGRGESAGIPRARRATRDRGAARGALRPRRGFALVRASARAPRWLSDAARLVAARRHLGLRGARCRRSPVPAFSRCLVRSRCAAPSVSLHPGHADGDARQGWLEGGTRAAGDDPQRPRGIALGTSCAIAAAGPAPWERRCFGFRSFGLR